MVFLLVELVPRFIPFVPHDVYTYCMRERSFGSGLCWSGATRYLQVTALRSDGSLQFRFRRLLKLGPPGGEDIVLHVVVITRNPDLRFIGCVLMADFRESRLYSSESLFVFQKSLVCIPLKAFVQNVHTLQLCNIGEEPLIFWGYRASSACDLAQQVPRRKRSALRASAVARRHMYVH